MTEYTPVDVALQGAIQKVKVRRRTVAVSVRDSYGRILAEDVIAPSDSPSFNLSHMDGYAVFADDIRSATQQKPAVLAARGSGRLGEPVTSLSRAEAFRVATGGRVPAGADTVVPVEDAEDDGRSVRVRVSLPPGSHIYGKGEDVGKGEAILRAGQPVRAQDVGVLVSFGFRRVKVRARPVVSVLATGSELTDSESPARGQVRNSHSPIFLRLIQALGCVAVDGGIARDDPRTIARAVRRVLRDSDFLLTLGGTSVGRRDYVGEAVEALRPEFSTRPVAMDRGRVTGIAVVRGKPVLMMPGPVQGAMNAFILFGKPVIDNLLGKSEGDFVMACEMEEGWTARERFVGFRKVVYVRLTQGRRLTARPLGGETESMKVLTVADGYVIVPENVAKIDAGTAVSVHLLPGFSFSTPTG